jgi:hypothetical protein
MHVIFLEPDQLGEFDSEGNMSKRPTRDTAGAEITGLHGTIKRLRFGGTKYFVTIPPGQDRPDIEYKLAESLKEPAPEKPVAKTAPKSEG